MTYFLLLLVFTSAIIHASWNLMVRARGANQMLLRVPLLITIIGLLPALWLEWTTQPFSPFVWAMLIITSIFQSFYYLGLLRGYEYGDFTMVYPIVRALPVLFIAIFDTLRGNQPHPAAWLGMVLVSMGCLVIPHTSFRNLQLGVYRNRVMGWVLLAAIGTVGYSVVDKLAAEQMAPGAITAARYYVYESAFTFLMLWATLRFQGLPTGLEKLRSDWPWSTVAAIGVFSSYWLILWAYQISIQASTIVAMRQISIVIGAVAGSLLFREPARHLRITAAAMITLGVILIAVTK
ncbi:MAG: EamA family transporter [Caldilineaceae bacterium]|jgi:drug/metabolite transporter (DMT)-like permease